MFGGSVVFVVRGAGPDDHRAVLASHEAEEGTVGVVPERAAGTSYIDGAVDRRHHDRADPRSVGEHGTLDPVAVENFFVERHSFSSSVSGRCRHP